RMTPTANPPLVKSPNLVPIPSGLLETSRKANFLNPTTKALTSDLDPETRRESPMATNDLATRETAKRNLRSGTTLAWEKNHMPRNPIDSREMIFPGRNSRSEIAEIILRNHLEISPIDSKKTTSQEINLRREAAETF